MDITVDHGAARFGAISAMDINRRNFFRVNTGGAPLRPPWLLDPAHFTDSCTRCRQCIELCPQEILVAGDGGFPRVDFEQGECSFCGDCTRACEADLFHNNLHSFATGWQHTAAIGEQCLTHFKVMCRSCEDACESRAIRFSLAVGEVPRPAVNTQECTGCGACISPCPENAIAMTTAGAPG